MTCHSNSGISQYRPGPRAAQLAEPENDAAFELVRDPQSGQTEAKPAG
ncbi:hypothetical protein LP420_08595 [Massilia sp. B-10]|nr:hypothetical protein LP420_08595 [Massilia sp. B-10]